ncbi:MAG: hypothetical protein WD003_01635 [Candidatus Paceibacterota bacterium]
MAQQSELEKWNLYKKQELALLKPLIRNLGFELENKQPHISGERYLMQAVTTTSGKKLILLGHRKHDGKCVVIKATRDGNGMRELEHEHVCRSTLETIDFAYDTFFFPQEFLFLKKSGFLIAVYEYIEQETPFIERPLQEQALFSLQAFKAQESARATVHNHIKRIKKTFEIRSSADYLETFSKFKKDIVIYAPAKKEVFEKAQRYLQENQENIEQYCHFLTHVDFVPHNFRIKDGVIYLLDYSSLRFGNKHEGWARFLNFMVLYNQELEQGLAHYIKINRAPEESVSLKALRLVRLAELIWYYWNTLEKTRGDLQKLNKIRIEFWISVFERLVEDEIIDPKTIQNYKKERDRLRSEEEKERQKKLH